MTEKYTVLYVDDEEANLRIFKTTFRRDFTIIVAATAQEGLKILETEKVDLVLTDQRMPGMTGVEFLKIINLRFPEIPPNRLIVSGYARDEDIEEAFQYYRLFKFISKPWKAEDMKQIILTAINENYEI